MSNQENDALREHLQDQLDTKLFQELIKECGDGAKEFLFFLDAKMSKPSMDQLINEFIWTKAGQSWYSQKLDQLYNSQPEGE